MRAKSQGFTLIELLVVIAIIAILAAMLFPVFARARESARKIQCLSNVKNIAIAVQMYLTDYDRFPPGMHDQSAQEWFNTAPGGGGTSGDFCWKANSANPYLRWPVIFAEYVKNRDVWRCPSAVFSNTFGVNWGYGTSKWFEYLRDSWDAGNGSGCRWARPCSSPFPPGWGGTITDSWKQDRCMNADTGGFEMTIGTPRNYLDWKTSQLSDPAKYVV